ncbi:Uncaracterized surface protein containing fasciclin (FAS1) repeats [Amycolatopsis arida]|uniref:Uncaracterized surface protein containing fasciclin (FAS1) repeats n=1 Tax=Amycolatopsis arida TaxID=587909 RepID=A0A1I5ZE69_9PSEU|nr:fasciclin domain-containing protein [Amycolatopsis arida]TDX89545.1 putative surface protein with fasciclin (FAS1) repeats [Amycolatopsis arida]SFQ54437.1 Uncaracterized surface protein containing fasciclin (FAS1) repeats [Amycolatopsis arida]
MKIRRVASATIASGALLALAACGSDGGNESQAPAPQAPATSAPGNPADNTASADGVTTASDVYGPGCSEVPTSGEGSVGGMVDDPVATAASNNPLLTKLVAAVKATNLVDTLNSQQAITVFAPADPAFDALGAKFDELAGKPTELAPILQYHVVGKRYDRDGLEQAGTVDSLNTAGGPLRIEGSGENMTVNGAKVLCGNIPTKNATVFVIDKVLMPGTNQ